MTARTETASQIEELKLRLRRLQFAERSLNPNARRKPPSAKCTALIEVAARCFGVTYAEMVSPLRCQPLTRYRQIAMYVARRRLLLSLPDIGRAFGDRDHTTVLHGIRLVTRRMEDGDQDMIDDVADLFMALDEEAAE